MAGDWLKVEHTTLDKPEVLCMAKRLNKSPEEVFGRLVRIWIWADQHSLDGKDLPITEDIIDQCAKHDGFAHAMREVGWLTGENGSLSFPNFDKHNGTTAKRRAEDSRRKGLKRKKKECPQNVRKMSAKVPKKIGQNAEQRREEKRREELNTKECAADAATADESKPPPDILPLKKERPRDELFDAVVEVTGVDPATAGSHVAKVCKSLRSSVPPYSPADVRKFWADHCGWLRLKKDRPTLGMLERDIGKVRAPPAREPPVMRMPNELTPELERLLANDEDLKRKDSPHGRAAC